MWERDAELHLARQIQQTLLPRIPQIDGFDIAAAWHPLDSASGDFYDFIPMPDGHIGIVIGDVAGHGAGPALLMATTRAYLRALARTVTGTGEIITQLNQMLVGDVGDRFVTLFFAEIDPRNLSMAYVDAGHGCCGILRDDGILWLDHGGLPLGIVPDTLYQSSVPVRLAKHDILIFSTDGATDSPGGVLPVFDIVKANRQRTAQDIIRLIIDTVLFLASGPDQNGSRPIPVEAEMNEILRMIQKRYGKITAMPDDVTAVVVKIG